MNNHYEVQIKTYRCFFQSQPASFRITKGGVTAFVGPNNSGKSTLLRFLYEMRSVLGDLTSGAWQQRQARQWGHNPRTGWQLQGGDTLDAVPKPFLPERKEIEFKINSNHFSYTLKAEGASLATRSVTYETHEDIAQPLELLQDAQAVLSNTLYFGPYRTLGTQGGSHYDLQVGTNFVTQWHSMKSGASAIHRKAALDTQKVIADLLSLQSLDIGPTSDNNSLILTFNGIEAYQLSEVGAGIGQLIIMLVSAAIQRPQIILVDEPELHLHPTMQIRFVQALSRFATYGIVCATHSLGLARQIADHIYVTSQDQATGKSSIRELDAVRNYSQLLGEMGYSQFSATGGSALLLVEGVTEVKVARTLLRKFGVEGKVLVIPLGGSALITRDRSHALEEFQRLGVPVFVVIDSEKDAADALISEERLAFKADCEGLFGANSVLVTSKRATENYFADDAVKQVLGERYCALTDFQKLSELSLGWGKEQNWQMANVMTKEQWEDNDFGRFFKRMAAEVENFPSSID